MTGKPRPFRRLPQACHEHGAPALTGPEPGMLRLPVRRLTSVWTERSGGRAGCRTRWCIT